MKHNKWIFVLCFIGILCVSCTPKKPIGHIIYLENSDQKESLYLTDGEGNRKQYLGEYSGTVSWSRDGSKIAVGCPPENTGSICILDSSTIPDLFKFPQDHLITYSPQTIREIDLSNNCSNRIDWLSWSSDDSHILAGCESTQCIISLDGEISCKEEDLFRSDWSPVEDLIAMPKYQDGKIKIFLVNSKNTQSIYLTDGWNPTWSPDGKQIAFMRYAEKWPEGPVVGLALINKDGSGFKWLYQPMFSPDDIWPDFYLNFYCQGYTSMCRLTWSPDSKYLAFTSNYGSAYRDQIYRINIQSGEIVYISDRLPNTFYAEPDWEP